MKRSTVAVCIVLACMALFAAQGMAQMEFGVGPVVGLNFSNVSFNPDNQYAAGVSQGGRTGIMFGAQAEIGFAKMFYIVLQPTYIGKGYGFTFPQGTSTVSVNELEFPVLFKVKFIKGVIRPYAFVGPNLGLVLSASQSVSVTGQTIPDTDLKPQTSSIDFALEFGAGAEYNVMPKMGITLDVRYALGLSNLSNPPANQVQAGATTQTQKSLGFQILAGVMFHIN
jgi:opacity protein-like surface antigen